MQSLFILTIVFFICDPVLSAPAQYNETLTIRRLSTSTPTFECSGSKATFIGSILWTLMLHNEVVKALEGRHVESDEEDVMRSEVSLHHLTSFKKEQNVTITCRAAVLNTTRFSQSNLTIHVQSPKPNLNGMIKCVNIRGFVHLTFVCITDPGVTLFRHDDKNQELCYGDICDHDTYHAKGTECPKSSFICTVHDNRTGGTNSREFTREECKAFVLEQDKCHGTPEDKLDHEPSINIPGIAVPTSIVGIIFLLLLVAACRWKAIREKLKVVTMSMLTEEEIREFLEGTKKFDPKDVHAVIHSQPFNVDFEISRHDLAFDDRNLLGSGQYGYVMKGTVPKIIGGTVMKDTKTTVAVKTVKPSADILYFKALLSEVKIMTHIGRHENIVEFVGACTSNIKNKEVFVCVEFCDKGDLHKCLQDGRKDFKNLFPDETPETPCSSTNPSSSSTRDDDTLSTMTLLWWAKDIANGMAFLGSKKVIHGDLAARNILISGKNVAKIGDFGLSRQLVSYSNYVKTQHLPLPWRWMSFESLTDMKFSCQTDVWAYGIVLWEIFSLGLNPYPGFEWDCQFVEKLSEGYRMKPPPHANKAVYDIMFSCWHLEPEKRPNFVIIYNQLQTLLSQLQGVNVGNEYVTVTE